MYTILGIMLLAVILMVIVCIVPIEKLGYPQSKEKEEKEPDLKSEKPTILGQSHFKLRHKMTTDDTAEKADFQAKKDNTFVSSEVFEEDNKALDIDFPLEEEEEISEAELTDEEEELESLFGKDAELATGVNFDDLFHTKQAIENSDSTPMQEEQAGKVLYENQHALLFEELISKQKSTGTRIATLVDIHLAKLKQELQEGSLSDAPVKTSDDYKNFDINLFIDN